MTTDNSKLCSQGLDGPCRKPQGLPTRMLPHPAPRTPATHSMRQQAAVAQHPTVFMVRLQAYTCVCLHATHTPMHTHTHPHPHTHPPTHTSRSRAGSTRIGGSKGLNISRPYHCAACTPVDSLLTVPHAWWCWWPDWTPSSDMRCDSTCLPRPKGWGSLLMATTG
jgi:hypothetical protein